MFYCNLKLEPCFIYYRMMVKDAYCIFKAFLSHLMSSHVVVFLPFQNEQVPAPGVQLHTQDLDLPRGVHPVPELRQGAASETQAEDLHRETGQRSHGSRVGRAASGCRESVWARWECGTGKKKKRVRLKAAERISERERKLVPSPPKRFPHVIIGLLYEGPSTQAIQKR